MVPGWLWAALAAPHLASAAVLVAPAQLRDLAARLGHDDATVPFAALLAVLSVAQLGAVVQFLSESQPRPGLALPLALRLGLAVPLLLGGCALKWSAAKALGRAGLSFGKQLKATARERALPAATAWPYTDLGATPAGCSAPSPTQAQGLRESRRLASLAAQAPRRTASLAPRRTP